MSNDRSDAAIERLLKDPLAAHRPPQGACLDAETLAAWADDELGAEERAAAELHAADCARCQALLAAMARTQPPVTDARAWWQRPIAWLVPAAAAVGAVALAIRVLVPAVQPELKQQVSVTEAPPPASPHATVDQVEQNAQTFDQKLKAAPAKPRPVIGGLRAEARQKRELDDRAAAADSVTVAPGRVAAPPDAVAQAAPMTRATAKKMAEEAAPVEIVSSNPGSRWRIVGGGAVQRSMDGGSTWQLQQTGVSTTLTAGSSPLPSVCWLVGRGGIVLLSTDGRSWRRLPFPESVDLAAVRATDATTATVTTVDGRTFTTTDSGETWLKAEG